MVVEIVTIRALGPAHDLPATVNRGRLGGDIARRNTEIDDLAVGPHDGMDRAGSGPARAHDGTAGIDAIRPALGAVERDRESTRLNSSHRCISYAVVGLEEKKSKCRAERRQ